MALYEIQEPYIFSPFFARVPSRSSRYKRVAGDFPVISMQDAHNISTTSNVETTRGITSSVHNGNISTHPMQISQDVQSANTSNYIRTDFISYFYIIEYAINDPDNYTDDLGNLEINSPAINWSHSRLEEDATHTD